MFAFSACLTRGYYLICFKSLIGFLASYAAFARKY
jgi:hypothetical protein